MYRLNPDCWVWTPRHPLCLHPQHSAMMSHQEEEEEDEEAGEHQASCCYTTGCHDFIKLSADAQRSPSEPSTSSCGLTGPGPGAPSSQQPFPQLDVARGGNVSQHFTGCCWEAPRMETQGCACIYGQKEPESLGPCWPGSPYVYTLRRNLVVGVEVVEEVAVEDTLEVITEDIYTDDFLDPELLEDVQLYPT